MLKNEADQRVATALVRHQKGDVEAAYREYHAVLTEMPEHPQALHYLGLVAQQTGHSDQAIDLIQRSIKIEPNDPRAYNHLGQILYQQGKMTQARDCFEKALAVDPKHVDSLNSLANITAKLGDLDQAIVLYKQALALDPRAINSLYNLANTLRERNSAGEAIEYYQRALTIDPQHVSSHHNLGVLLEQQGRFAEAITHYQAVFKIKPDHSKSLANLIAIRSYQPDEGVVAAAERYLEKSSLDDQDLIKLHHGLGKHYDRLQHYDRAFSHFKNAKTLVRNRSGTFDENQVVAYFDRLIATFSAEYFRQLAPCPVDSSRLVFIVGMPRSGTTLTEQILASHPSIFGAGELQGIPDITRSLRPHYPECTLQWQLPQRREVAERYLKIIAALAPESALRVTDKLPVNFTHLGLIASLFPQARVIHCRRDPLDVALSCFIELFQLPKDFTTDLKTIGQYFLQYHRLMTHWQKVLPLAIHEQRYEELIANPETGSRALVAHCGLPWNYSCLNFQTTERVVKTPSRWQVRQPIYARSVGRWRNYASHFADLQQLLTERGYLY
jgi:tetratricopeptide (TPR) repeat protein